MFSTAVRVLALLLTALLVGTMFGIWLGFDPAALSPSAFVRRPTVRSQGISLL